MKQKLNKRKVKTTEANYDERAFWYFFLSPSFIFKLRCALYDLIDKNVNFNSRFKVLDLGVGDNDHNYFHKLYPHRKNITAAGLARRNKILNRDYPLIKYVQINTKFPYPFKSGEFDFIHSSAVIEHVGSRKRQQQFLIELNRIGKSGAVTTPNRWFPLEVHTFLPLIHWLPTKIYRKIFILLGLKYYAKERNLNLLTLQDLIDLASKAGFKSYKIIAKKTLGFDSNYLLMWSQK